MKHRKKCDCLLCKPVEGKRAHPKYGYDLDLVAVTECIHCGAPIGTEPYIEITCWARFGQMMFRHRRCAGSKLQPALDLE